MRPLTASPTASSRSLYLGEYILHMCATKSVSAAAAAGSLLCLAFMLLFEVAMRPNIVVQEEGA